MNISFNWLKRYIDLSMSAEETAKALTSIGLETGGIEEVESIRGGLKGIVTGHVLTCVDHPDSDHLHITTVDLGDGQATQIVCGAPNVAAGQYVVVATVGTTLYDGDKTFQIKKSKIRGVESFGMICAHDEIGTGTSHDGIIVLPDTPAPGTPAAEYFGLTSDYVLEVDLTPNRIDAASHYGVARDLKAYLDCHANGTELRKPEGGEIKPDRQDGAIEVTVDDSEGCGRYSGVTIRGVKVADSPKWLHDLLTAAGVRPINNIVDITNFILLGLGQPMHAFDLSKIDGGRIVVKTCPEGTPFTTLDGVERKLNDKDLMICSAEKPMCIAGVFGGLDSGVTDNTTDIFLESAWFNPTRVRKTARRHGLNTDASFRYERGTDPNATMWALEVAARLVKEIAGGEICGMPIDIYPQPVKPAEVTLDYDYMTRLVGQEIPADTVNAIARSLEMREAAHTDNSVTLEIPTYRVDVTRPCDVVEDILRIYGYNNVATGTELHAALQLKTETDSIRHLQTLVSEQLTAQGFNEILCNSLTAESYYTSLPDYPADNCVRLLNPLSADLSVMRQTLLFGGLESLARNINRRASGMMAYEFGNVYSRKPELQPQADAPLAPYRQGARLGLWMTGEIAAANWLRPAVESSIFDLRAYVSGILSRLGITASEIKTSLSQRAIYSTGIDIVTRSGKPVGHMGLLTPEVLKMADIKQPVAFAELDWDTIARLSLKKSVSFKPLAKTLPVRRDLALLIDCTVTMDQIEAVVRESERKLLRSIELFDVYEGDKLPQGKKSYAIAITLQDDEKTLVDKQIEATMTKITTNLAKRLGAELR